MLAQNVYMMTIAYKNIERIIKYEPFKGKLYKWIVNTQYDADGVAGYK